MSIGAIWGEIWDEAVWDTAIWEQAAAPGAQTPIGINWDAIWDASIWDTTIWAQEDTGVTGTLDADLQALTAAFTGTYAAPVPGEVTGSLGASLEALTASLTGTFSLYSHPLKVGATTIRVRPGGHRAREVPMAPEVVIGIDGTAFSGITQYRGYRTRVSIETPELDASEAASLYTVLSVGTPLAFTGYLVGGSLTGVVRNLRWIPGDIDRALAFDIVQS